MGEALITRRGGSPVFEEMTEKTYNGSGFIEFRNLTFENTRYYMLAVVVGTDDNQIYLSDSLIENGVETPLHNGSYVDVRINGDRLTLDYHYALTAVGEAYLYKI